MLKIKNFSFSKFLFDVWCTISVIGIWPRFIEPNLIVTTKLHLPIKNLPKDLVGFKILQFSDLHFNSKMSNRFLEKLERKIKQENPDMIVFTGDLLCYSELVEPERLKNFLNRFNPKFGAFLIFGNHDYEQFISINEHGEYDLVETSTSTLKKGFKRLFSSIKLQNKISERVKKIGFHKALVRLIQETPFKILHNSHIEIKKESGKLNLIGLGEYSLGKLEPELAFQDIDVNHPTIVLAHHPDSFPLLKSFPSHIILSGHTHGGQINLPFFRKKFTLLENEDLIRGLIERDQKKIYINRGIGSVMKFRWFASPEILSLTLKEGEEL